MCYSTLHTAMSVMELLHIFCIGHSAAPHTGDHSRDRGVTWPRESSQPKLFPEATNQFQVGSRRVEQVRWPPRPRHQLTSYPGRCGGAARLASPAQPSPAQPSLDQRTFVLAVPGGGAGLGWCRPAAVARSGKDGVIKILSGGQTKNQLAQCRRPRSAALCVIKFWDQTH